MILATELKSAVRDDVAVVIRALTFVIPALTFVIPALTFVIPALTFVIPAKAGIQRFGGCGQTQTLGQGKCV